MSRTISLIQRVEIASPCTASWDEMTGDDKSRFCSECKLNVYNLSAMTLEQAEQLIIEKEGKLCARIYRRRDGTVITSDCPKGLAAIRRHAFKLSVKFAAAVVFLFCSAAYAARHPRPFVSHSLAPRDVCGFSAYKLTTEAIRSWLTDFRAPRPAPILGKVSMPRRSVRAGPPMEKTQHPLGWTTLAGELPPQKTHAKP